MSEDEKRDAAPGPRPRRWRASRDLAQQRTQRQAFLGCGSLAILVGIALVVGERLSQEEGVTRVTLAGACLALFGLVSIRQALTTKKSESDAE